MRKWTVKIVCACLGLAFGFGIGYMCQASRTVAKSPVLANTHPSGDGVTLVFEGAARLGADEIAARTNGGDFVLDNEAEAISAIQRGSEKANLNPPLDVAWARLAVRKAVCAEQRGNIRAQLQAEKEAEGFLRSAAWADPSAAHMRTVVSFLDKPMAEARKPGEKK